MSSAPYEELQVEPSVDFKPHEWGAWSAFHKWKSAEEKEIEDEAEFKQSLCDKFHMEPKMLNCLLTLGIYAGEEDEKLERHGLGKSIYPNQDTFVGDFVHGKRHGRGTYFKRSVPATKLDAKVLKAIAEWRKYSAAQAERGEAVETVDAFVARLADKHCVIRIHPTRTQQLLRFGHGHPFFEGEFAADKKTGFCTVRYDDGSVYIGEHHDDLRHGSGVYIYANSDEYRGGWHAGLKHGEGVYTFFGQDCAYEGVWEAGVLKSGRWLFCDGVSYVGGFHDITPVPKQAGGGGGGEEEEPPADDGEAPAAVTVRKTYPCGKSKYVFPHLAFEAEGTYDEKHEWNPAAAAV